MAKSIWPHDTYIDPSIEPPPTPHNLTCFVLSPSTPKERWDDLFKLVQGVCNSLRSGLQIHEFECERATDIVSAGVIHPEIWERLKMADIIVVDISGQNGNVMMQLGVAAGWRKKEHVVIIREIKPEEAALFNINPARYLEYERTYSGFQKLHEDLRTTIFEALSAAPFAAMPKMHISLPFKVALDDQIDCGLLWTPDIGHRRMLENCLEFGSLYVFKNSWLSIGDLKIRNVRVKAEMRFTLLKEDQPGWIGIMLRSQGFYANFGHLVNLGTDGAVNRTVPEDGLGHYHDERIGQINNFAPKSKAFILFDVSMNEEELCISVGPVQKSFPIKEMPYVFGSGRILIQTYKTRAGIRNSQIEEI